MNGALKRLLEIRNEIDKIHEDILYGYSLNVDIDDRRAAFLLTEFDSLVHVLELIESKGYKEALILIRSSFEKFFYFWLMLEGKKYRWTMRHYIQRSTSSTDREARDITLEKWREAKKRGDPLYTEVIDIQPGKEENVIVTNYEWTGLEVKKDGKPTGELVPIYNFMVYEYESNVRFLTGLSSIMEGEKYPDIRKKEEQTQKMIYHQFINFDNILRNLLLNGLIDESQKEMIVVHYNFLSSHVHVGKESIETWLYYNPRYEFYRNSKVDEKVIAELVFLYVAKLMHLYLKAMITHYKVKNTKFNPTKYDSIINELDTFSKDFWFIDNEPSEFDKKDSTHRKSMRDAMSGEKKLDTVDVLYYENPLTRLNVMRTGVRFP